MSEKVMSEIIKEMKAAKYYSIIVDSSPDISHVDQLSFIIQYVKPNGIAVEHFLKLLDNPGHKGLELYNNAVVSTLGYYNIDKIDMRGQSYDNAPNMKGQYKGLRSRSKETSIRAKYTPRIAHWLNIIGTHAVECCHEDIKFFALSQKLYNFFTESTYQYEILQGFSESGKISLKSLSNTQWAVCADTTRALKKYWREINQALVLIENDGNEKLISRNTARGTQSNLEQLETAFILNVWPVLLSHFKDISVKSQSVDTSLPDILDLCQSLSILWPIYMMILIFMKRECRKYLL